MHLNQDKVGVQRTSCRHILAQQVVVDIRKGVQIVVVEDVNGVFKARHRDGVGAVGIGQKGNGDAVYVFYQNTVIGVALLLRAVGANMVKPVEFKNIKCAENPRLQAVNTVVAGGVYHVEADGFKGCRKLRRRLEHGVTGILHRFGESSLHSADSIVRFAHRVPYSAENRCVVVASVLLLGFGIQPGVNHDIAADAKLDLNEVFRLLHHLGRWLGS